MAFIGAKPTNVPLTSADLEDSIITSAKIVDGTIATADISDGAVTSVKTTGVGGANTPAFFAHSASTQSGVSDNTFTKATLGTVVFDTDSAFSSSKFTVPTGEDGKYFFSFKVTSAGSTDYQKSGYSVLYKNGSNLGNDYETILFQESGVFNMDRIGIHGSVILDLSAGDYIELYGKADVNSGNVNFYQSFLAGYKIIT